MKSLQTNNDKNPEAVHELLLTEDLSLVHAPGVRQGKTRDMAKGLFLLYQGRMCAGESAGFGLPVFKTARQTYFPSLSSIKSIGGTIIVTEFRMDRVLVWRIAGKKFPDLVSRVIEHLVNVYMKRPAMQKRLLRLREFILESCAITSTMVQGTDQGRCRVVYEATAQGVHVCVDGGSIQGRGELMVLNEVEGRSFTRLRIGDRILRDAEIPSWKGVDFGSVLESPVLGLGISLSFARGSCSVFCGREVSLGLDWAGFAIMSKTPVVDYQVHFHIDRARQKTKQPGKPGIVDRKDS